MDDFVNKVKERFEESSKEYIDLKKIEDTNDCWIIELCLKKAVCFELDSNNSSSSSGKEKELGSQLEDSIIEDLIIAEKENENIAEESKKSRRRCKL